MAGFLTIALSFPALAQDLLPEGVGLYQFGYRGFATQTSSYNANGNKVPLGTRFDKSFTGQRMLNGDGGPDLQHLATELKKYDGDNNSSSPLLDELNLGQLSGEIKADVKTQFLALAFGLNKHFTLFMAVPWIEAHVSTKLSMTGSNNAATIKAQLGDLAYDELKAGLDKASQISEDQIQENIANLGYSSIDEWSHKGFGDLQLGVKTGDKWRLNRKTSYSLGLTTTFVLPTGYYENPDVLTDVSLGQGYMSLGATIDQRLVFLQNLLLGARTTYVKSLPSQVKKRVPEAREDLVAADRKKTVHLNAGDNTDAAGLLGFVNDWLESTYALGVKRHFTDRYSGSLDGDYDTLGKNSNSYQLYQEMSLSLSSVKAYQKKRFVLPAVLTLSAHAPLKARNSTDERYFELSVSSFFSTQTARNAHETQAAKRQAAKERYANKLAKQKKKKSKSQPAH
jgi:hypothetical protein